MAETNPPLPRRMTLAHQPFYGVLDLKSGENLTLQEFIGEGDYGDLIVKRRLNLEHDLIEGNVRYVCQRCHALTQADFGDHVLVDNRHNAVGLAHGSAGLGAGGGQQCGNQQFFHWSFPGASLILL